MSGISLCRVLSDTKQNYGLKTLILRKNKNRRYYSPSLHRFMNLEEICEYWDRDIEIFVTCVKRQRDITIAVVLEMLSNRLMAGNTVELRKLIRFLESRHADSWKELE